MMGRDEAQCGDKDSCHGDNSQRYLSITLLCLFSASAVTLILSLPDLLDQRQPTGWIPIRGRVVGIVFSNIPFPSQLPH